jgi:SAM-dependent methyltransferase
MSLEKKREVLGADIHKNMLKKLKAKRVVEDCSFDDFLKVRIKNKNVLDIGVCEHSIEHIESEGWKHKVISKLAKYSLGIDIDAGLVDYLRTKGFNVKCVDATSDYFMGESFDFIFIGDVIEHVNDPVKLLKFAKRHLKENGEILVGTPNPFFIKYVWRNFREGTFIANLEHCFWITPTMMMEICRRASLEFCNYIFFSYSKKPITIKIKQILFSKFNLMEMFGEHYWYLLK